MFSSSEIQSDSESVVPHLKAEFPSQTECVQTISEEPSILPTIEDFVDLEKEVLNVLPEINIDVLNEIENLVEDAPIPNSLLSDNS